MKNGAVALISLIDPKVSKAVDGFATPALSAWAEIADLLRMVSRRRTGNLVGAAVGLVKLFGGTQDSTGIALQQIQEQLKAISNQLTVIDKKLDVIDGKLDTVISKLDDVVNNQNANT